MDPTKPILDLYSNSNYYDYREENQPKAKQLRPSPQKQQYIDNRKSASHKQISYSDLKLKYQELYQAYNEKVEQINYYEEEVEKVNTEKQHLKQQIYELEDKNEHLNATLLNKNVELEEAYRHLQEDLKKNNKNKKNQEAMDRLEEGLREAITSNFHLLREAALSEAKHATSFRN